LPLPSEHSAALSYVTVMSILLNYKFVVTVNSNGKPHHELYNDIWTKAVLHNNFSV